MKISVFGSGYVGLVTASCLAQVGHDVVCIDVDPDRVARLNRGECPIFEPGLEESLRTGLADGLLRFTTEPGHAINGMDVIFIAVGTPPGADGAADIGSILQVARTIGEQLWNDTLVVIKSTAPVGTAEHVHRVIRDITRCRELNLQVNTASNPEFLKEGSAVSDFMRPDRIIVGCDSEEVVSVFRRLYAAFNRNHDRLMVMDVRSAELAKYAANAMLATKISFINEIARIAETVDADIEQVRKGIGADERIGYHFIYPGCGYGGSCFPKDVQALASLAAAHGYQPKLLPAVEDINAEQKQQLFRKLENELGDPRGATIAVWGLSFKPNTDDIRDAPSLELIRALLDAGAQVQAFDPQAGPAVASWFGGPCALQIETSKEAALQHADALVICTEWKSFWSPDLAVMRSLMRGRLIIDGRNLYDHAYLSREGFEYHSIGRPHQPMVQDSLWRVPDAPRHDRVA